MDLATLALGFVLIFASGAMVLALFRSRSRANPALPPESEPGADAFGLGLELGEPDFRRRQFRRRMQGSLMVGALGLLVLFGVLLADPWWRLAHALALLLFSVWLMLLAIADWVATRHFFGRARHNLLLDEVRLQAELRQAALQRRGQSNGQGD